MNYNQNNLNYPNNNGIYNNQSTNQPINQIPMNNIPSPVPTQPASGMINPQIPPPLPSKKGKTIMFVGIGVVLVAVIIATIIIAPKLLSEKNSNDKTKNPTEQKEQITAAGKIPYNKEINSCAMSNIEYKDNTRNLCENSSSWFTSKSNGLIYGHIDYQSFSFYLDTDENNILSYKRSSEDKYGFNFISAFKDDTANHYVYLFYEMENDNYIYLTSSSANKILSSIDFTNFTEKETSDGKKLEVPKSTIKGYYNSTYRMNVKVNGISASLIHIGESDVNVSYETLKYFSEFLSVDNGSPFLFDLVINQEPTNDYYVKSYKYINKLSTESNVRGERYTYLHYNLKNNNISYDFADTYSYMPDFFTKYEVYQTKMLANNKTIHGTYIPEDSQFMVVIELKDKYYVNNADPNLGAEYYINNYTEMFVSKDSQGFGPVEKYTS